MTTFSYDELLKAVGIAQIVIEYSGSGDEGYINDISVQSLDGTVSVDLELGNELYDLLRDEAHDLLESESPGWGNQRGFAGRNHDQRGRAQGVPASRPERDHDPLLRQGVLMSEIRVHPSWEKVGGIPLAIMRGEHDDVLESISQACGSRLKDRFRKGSKHRLVNTKSVELDGKEVVVTKANVKSVSVTVTETGLGYNVPPRMLEAIA